MPAVSRDCLQPQKKNSDVDCVMCLEVRTLVVFIMIWLGRVRCGSPNDVTILQRKMAGTRKSQSLTPVVELSMLRAQRLVVKRDARREVESCGS